MSVEVIENILSLDLINELHEYVSSRSHEYVWRNATIAWPQDLTVGSSSVMIMDLEKFRDKLYNEVAEKIPSIKQLELELPFPMFHSIPPMGLMGWHEDYNPINVTIYLNEFWDKQWGGLFLYEEEDEIKVIKPKFNNGVVVSMNQPHGVSMIPYTCPISRYSVQLFFIEEGKNEQSY